MGIVIAIVATFVLTVLWQKWADRRNKLPLRVTLKAMMNELNLMSKELGYEDIKDYWKSTKGDDYAQVATINLENALDSLK